MSDYGFYAKNDSGFVQVDSEYDNVAVVLEGSTIVNYWTGYAPELGYFYGQFTYPGPSVNRTRPTQEAPNGQGFALGVNTVPTSVPDDYLIFAKPADTSFNVQDYYGSTDASLDIDITRRLCMTHSPSLVRASGFRTNYGLWVTDKRRFYLFSEWKQDYRVQVMPWEPFIADYKICIRSRDMPNTTSSGMGIKVFKSNGEESYSSKNKNFRMSHSIDGRDAKAPATVGNTYGNVGWDIQNVVIDEDDFKNTYALMNGRHPCHIEPYYYPQNSNVFGVPTVGSSMTWSYAVSWVTILNTIQEGPMPVMWGPYFAQTPNRTHQVTGIFGKFT